MAQAGFHSVLDDCTCFTVIVLMASAGWNPNLGLAASKTTPRAASALFTLVSPLHIFETLECSWICHYHQGKILNFHERAKNRPTASSHGICHCLLSAHRGTTTLSIGTAPWRDPERDTPRGTTLPIRTRSDPASDAVARKRLYPTVKSAAGSMKLPLETT